MNSLEMEQRVPPPNQAKTAAAAAGVVKAKYSSTEPYDFSKYTRRTKLHKSPIQQVQDRLRVFPSMEGKTSELGVDPFRPGYLKIGKTDRSSGDRTNEQRRDCKRYLQEYIPNYGKSSTYRACRETYPGGVGRFQVGGGLQSLPSRA